MHLFPFEPTDAFLVLQTWYKSHLLFFAAYSRTIGERTPEHARFENVDHLSKTVTIEEY